MSGGPATGGDGERRSGERWDGERRSDDRWDGKRWDGERQSGERGDGERRSGDRSAGGPTREPTSGVPGWSGEPTAERGLVVVGSAEPPTPRPLELLPRGAAGSPEQPSGGVARMMVPAVDIDRVAPAGWPQDVVRRTGRISAADVLAAPAMIDDFGPAGRDAGGPFEPGAVGPTRPRSTNRRRRPPPRRSSPTRALPEPPAPWPGRLPAPSPATVPPEPLPADLVDAAGRPVWLTASDLLSAPPHRLVIDGGEPRDVEGWAGPWPVRQRWWSPDEVTGSRLQLLCRGGDAFLLISRAGKWWITGIYD